MFRKKNRYPLPEKLKQTDELFYLRTIQTLQTIVYVVQLIKYVFTKN